MIKDNICSFSSIGEGWDEVEKGTIVAKNLDLSFFDPGYFKLRL